MSDLLLDTNTLSYILKEVPPVVDQLNKREAEGACFLLAPVVHYELTRYLELKGASRLMRLYQELTEPWQLCDVSFEDWDAAAQLWAERHRLGRSISDIDLLLAILARKHGAILVTSNVRHFENLGLVLEDWTSALEPESQP
jgi:tRNA(fMet)-specific endonuclease VapC